MEEKKRDHKRRKEKRLHEASLDVQSETKKKEKGKS